MPIFALHPFLFHPPFIPYFFYFSFTLIPPQCSIPCIPANLFVLSNASFPSVSLYFHPFPFIHSISSFPYIPSVPSNPHSIPLFISFLLLVLPPFLFIQFGAMHPWCMPCSHMHDKIPQRRGCIYLYTVCMCFVRSSYANYVLNHAFLHGIVKICQNQNCFKALWPFIPPSLRKDF